MYVFETDRLRVREVTKLDAKLFADWWNNGLLMAPMGFPMGLNVSVEEMEERFALQEVRRGFDLERKTYVIENKLTQLPIGELTYGAYDSENKTLGLAMKICDLDEQGKGYGKESLLGFMGYLYSCLGLKKIIIDSLKDNERAMQLYQRVGFKITEIRYDFWKDPQGIEHDLVMMEMLREEWNELYKS